MNECTTNLCPHCLWCFSWEFEILVLFLLVQVLKLEALSSWPIYLHLVFCNSTVAGPSAHYIHATHVAKVTYSSLPARDPGPCLEVMQPVLLRGLSMWLKLLLHVSLLPLCSHIFTSLILPPSDHTEVVNLSQRPVYLGEQGGNWNIHRVMCVCVCVQGTGLALGHS